MQITRFLRFFRAHNIALKHLIKNSFKPLPEERPDFLPFSAVKAQLWVQMLNTWQRLEFFWLDLCQLWWPSVPILANLEICEWQIWAAAKCRPDAQSNVSWSEMAQWEKRACSYPTQPTVFLANMSLQCKQILFENLFGFSGKWSGDEDFDLICDFEICRVLTHLNIWSKA